MDSISTASSGLLVASARFNTAGGAIVSAANSGSTSDLASAVVGQSLAGDQVQASAAVIKTSDKLFKALLDITV